MARGHPSGDATRHESEARPRHTPGVGMRIAFIAAECEPWAKTGGLADVVDALARALGEVGGTEVDGLVDVFIPNYRSVPVPEGARRIPITVPDPMAAGGQSELHLLVAETHGYRLHLVDHPPAFDRDGMYGTPTTDHPDNAWRFGLLCRVALEHLRAAAHRGERPPDVIHIHDWHAVPALLLRDGLLASDPAIGRAAFVLTVHNLAYHGWTPSEHVAELGLGAIAGPGGAGQKDGIDLLRAGIERAELVNTVSPGFAAEALGPEMGMGLDPALRARGDRFFGILNGIDDDLWDPATDAALPAGYSRADRSGKRACRAALLEEVGLDPADPRPVLAMVGRLDRQKGFDLLAEATPALLDLGLRLAVLGSGNYEVVAPLRELATSAAGRGRISLMERFDRDLARRLYAGADGFLDAVSLRAVRHRPDGGAALRDAADRPRDGRPARHGGRRRRQPGDGHGLRLRAGQRRRPRRGVHALPCPVHRRRTRVGCPAGPRHGRRLRLAHGLRAGLPRRLPPRDRHPPIWRKTSFSLLTSDR